jgi:hypothetical protein
MTLAFLQSPIRFASGLFAYVLLATLVGPAHAQTTTRLVAQDRDRGAEHNDDRVCRLRLRNRARNAFREIARIPRGELQSVTALVGVQ